MYMQVVMVFFIDKFFNSNEMTAWFLVFLKVNITNHPVWCDFFLNRLSHRDFLPIANYYLS